MRYDTPIFESDTNIVKMKTDSNSLFAFVKIKSAIHRVNLNTGDIEQVLDVGENLIYDFHVVKIPTIGEILVVSADRDEGIFIFSVNNCHKLFTKKFGPKEDLYCSGVIQKFNIIVSGSITGMIRLL